MSKSLLSLKSLLFLFVLLNGFLSFGQAGTVDMTFNPDDNVISDGMYYKPSGVIKQADGKLVLVGFFTIYNGTPCSYIVRINSNGSVEKTFKSGTGCNGYVRSIAQQVDGKMIIVGNFTSYDGNPANGIARLNSDGSFDPTFSSGTGPNNVGINKLVLQSDGKMIIAGGFTTYNQTLASGIARLMPDGTIDNSFKVYPSDNIYSIAIQPDGKILIGGKFDYCNSMYVNRLTRLNIDGSIDVTFNPSSGVGGSSYPTVNKIFISSDGKIIISGSFNSFNNNSAYNIVRLNSNGSIDNSFLSGSGFDSYINDIQEQADGKILVAGLFKNYNGKNVSGIIRLNTNGLIDTAFNQNIGSTGAVDLITILEDGFLFCTNEYDDIIVGGVVKVNSNGYYDFNFNPKTGANNSVNALAQQFDEKLLIAGQYSIYNNSKLKNISRLNLDGSVDYTFNSGSGLVGTVKIIKTQSNGKILIAGSFDSYNGSPQKNIVRLNKNGEVDNSFIIGQGFNGRVNALCIQKDEKIIVGGEFTNYDGKDVNYIVRLNTDGTIDNSFQSGAAFDYHVNSLYLQENGQILVGGKFSNYNQNLAEQLIRINADGTIDNSFSSNISMRPNTILQQKDGKYLISSYHVQRLNYDGTTDSTFNDWFKQEVYGDSALTIVLQENQKIIAFGNISSYGDYKVNNIVRLNSNGIFDSTFVVGAGANSTVNSALLLASGDILIGGAFTLYNGVIRNRIARLKGDSTTNDICTLNLNFNTTKDLSCEIMTGNATATAYHGKEPFIYSWLNASNSNDSIAIFNQSGVYTCTVTDANGCSDTASLWIAGSKYPAGFELNSSLINLNPFRTGFDVKVVLNAVNLGCVNQNGQLKLVLDDLVSYQNATPAPDFISGDTLIWNFSNLYYLSTQFSPKVTLKTSTLAAIGDSVHLKVIVTPSLGDADVSNNTRDYKFRVINGYDPNDISVNPQGLCEEGYVKNDQTLTYTVRFQNTGNAEAVNIAVVDSLNSNLDMNTLRVISASDTMYTLIESGNVVKFMFDSIMLKDSLHFEPESHGYVVFEIKPKAGLSDSTKIKNKVGIYFDFNPAVLTNSVLNTIYSSTNQLTCKPTTTNKITTSKSQIYPNPSEGIFNLVSATTPQNISVYDQTGKLLINLTPNQSITTLDLSKTSNGIYFIQVKTKDGIETIKAVVSK